MARAGERPEVVLEATYGWYWAADALAELGASEHLAHPLGVKAFEYRRVKNDVRDAADLADLLRMGRLPEAWIAPREIRELRGLVRHRAKLVAVRVNLKCQIHAVLAGAGVAVAMSDLFGLAGTDLLDRVVRRLGEVDRRRLVSLRRVLELVDGEIDRFQALSRAWLGRHRGYRAIQAIPGVGPVLAAVFVAELGDVTRFPDPARLASWAGLTHATGSPTPPCTAGASPSRARGWCAGPRSKPCNGSPCTTGSAGCASGSPSGVAATSARSPPPANSPGWSTTGCATGTSARWPHEFCTAALGAGRPGHDPRTPAWSPVLIDPDGRTLVAALHAAAQRRRDEPAALRACPPTRTALESPDPTHHSRERGPDTPGSPPRTACAGRRRRQGPTAAPRSALRADP
jgi:hypothetical protein